MKIAVIRITGQVGLNKDVKETLYRLRIRRKYACVVLDGTKENLGMIKKVRDFVAFGEISDEVHKELIEKRGRMSKNLKESNSSGKKVEGKLKPFFRLHPPRKGIDAKKHFGVKKGVLGNNKNKINELIRRML